jgi:hypothetical protein
MKEREKILSGEEKTSRPARQLFVSLDRADNVIEGAAAFGSNVAGFDFSPARCEPEQSIPDKIRQRLQVLRDLNLLEFLGSGSYGLH